MALSFFQRMGMYEVIFKLNYEQGVREQEACATLQDQNVPDKQHESRDAQETRARP